MFSIIRHTGKLLRVHSQGYKLNKPFIELAENFSEYPGTMVLLSGAKASGAKNNILALWPWLRIRGFGKHVELCTGRYKKVLKENPFIVLNKLVQAYQLQVFPEFSPVCAGLFGYFSYDLKDQLEDLPKTSLKDLDLPDLVMYAPSLLLIQDLKKDEANIHIPVFDKRNNLNELLNTFYHKEASRIKHVNPKSIFQHTLLPESSKDHYLRSISRIKEYIASGHVYQVNLSQRFQTNFSGQGYALFKNLFKQNPAPFYAFLNCADHQILSTSPERFLKQEKNIVITEPIKGTIPRGKVIEEDKNNIEKLLKSEKDDAELSMIVDLLRNDLGKVCQAGTIKVKEHKRLESYTNVHHLVSSIQGKLRPEYNSLDLLQACFPGGSITGCPKVRAMEIIDQMEPYRRHVYTGSLGYISFHESLDLSIAIRTAVYYKEKLYFSVGGGIVYDSNPELEYEETIHKGQTLFKALEISSSATESSYKQPKKQQESGISEAEKNQHLYPNANLGYAQKGQKSKQTEQRIWFNGSLFSKEEVKINPLCPGLEYGFGFFETIRADQGNILHLSEHIKRFNQAWSALFKKTQLDLTWNDIFYQVLEANNLLNKTARIKLMAFKNSLQEKNKQEVLLVQAQTYEHRLKKINKSGLSLVTYPYPRESPLAKFKTLNYLYYLLAGQWAQNNHADEALILNPDGSISETNSTGLIMLKKNKAYIPKSKYVLMSIMQQRVIQELPRLGIQVESRVIFPAEIGQKDSLILCNSLIGAAPALRLDQENLKPCKLLCRQLNKLILNRKIP